MRPLIIALLGLGVGLMGNMSPAQAFKEADLKRLEDSGRCVGCDLRDAKLSQRDLSQASLTAANLQGADLRGAVLGRVSQTDGTYVGAVLINADLTQIEDEKNRELIEAFSTIVANDGLAFYPDWPAPGYMDVLGGGLQELIAGSVTPDEFLDQIAGPWQEYKATLDE